MKTFKGISPLLAAVILVALVISVAFIVSSAISGMAQRQASAASETAQASGALLEVDLDSVTCDEASGKLQMVVRLTGTTKSASGITVVVKDAAGNLYSNTTTDYTLSPGVNVVEVNITPSVARGPLSYLAVSTQDPSIHIDYTNSTFGNIGECE